MSGVIDSWSVGGNLSVAGSISGPLAASGSDTALVDLDFTALADPKDRGVKERS